MTTVTKGILETMMPYSPMREIYIMGRKAYAEELRPWDCHTAVSPCVFCGAYHVVVLKDKRDACRRCGRPRGA